MRRLWEGSNLFPPSLDRQDVSFEKGMFYKGFLYLWEGIYIIIYDRQRSVQFYKERKE